MPGDSCGREGSIQVNGKRFSLWLEKSVTGSGNVPNKQQWAIKKGAPKLFLIRLLHIWLFEEKGL